MKTLYFNDIIDGNAIIPDEINYIVSYFETFKKELSVNGFNYYLSLNDENVIMTDKKTGDIISNNYFAIESFYEDLTGIHNRELKPDYITLSSLYYAMYMDEEI